MYSSKWKGKENHDILIILFERNKSKFLREQRDKENIYIFTFIVVI